MPKINQKNIQVFHFLKENTKEEIKAFLAKNHKILQSYLLVFDEINDELKECLESYELDYIVPKKLRLNATSKPLELDSNEKSNQKSKDSNKESNPNIKPSFDRNSQDSTQSPTKIYTELIRSGADINSSGDIVIFNSINSAAHIKSSKNICIFGRCDGNVKCNGEYMILSNNIKGKVSFNGLPITANMLKYKLNLIIKDNGVLNIIDILSL